MIEGGHGDFEALNWGMAQIRLKDTGVGLVN